MLSYLVENVQMLRQVQSLLEENAKPKTSVHFQSFSLLQQGMKCKDCKRSKWSTPSPETGSISIIRESVYSDQLEQGRKGFGSRLLTCCRNGLELAATSPPIQVPWRWSPLAGKQAWAWGGLGCPKEAGGAVSGLHHDSLHSTGLLLHCWAHPGADMQVLQTPPEKLCKTSVRAQQYLSASVGINMQSR